MKAEDASFLALLGSGQRQFIIPMFQRGYSCTEAQCSQLLDGLTAVVALPCRIHLETCQPHPNRQGPLPFRFMRSVASL